MTKIVRTRIMTVGTLSGAERSRIREDLVDIFMQSFDGPDPDTVADRVIFRDPTAELMLLYAADGEIVGFISHGIEEYDIKGHRHAVFDAGAYIRPGVTGGGIIAVTWGLLQALRYKLRHPLVSMCYVGEATGPVPYARVGEYWPGSASAGGRDPTRRHRTRGRGHGAPRLPNRRRRSVARSGRRSVRISRRDPGPAFHRPVA